MSAHNVCLLIAGMIGIASAAPCQPVGSASTRPKVVTSVTALKKGAAVTDRTGALLGPIQALSDGPGGAMVVIEIDGKLVSVPAATLTAKGAFAAMSSQTKSEIVAAAGAPP
jgi:hypothetical protein